MNNNSHNIGGVPKPGFLIDFAKKKGISDKDIYLMEYNELLRFVELGGEKEGKSVLPNILNPNKENRG